MRSFTLLPSTYTRKYMIRVTDVFFYYFIISLKKKCSNIENIYFRLKISNNLIFIIIHPNAIYVTTHTHKQHIQILTFFVEHKNLLFLYVWLHTHTKKKWAERESAMGDFRTTYYFACKCTLVCVVSKCTNTRIVIYELKGCDGKASITLNADRSFIFTQ